MRDFRDTQNENLARVQSRVKTLETQVVHQRRWSAGSTVVLVLAVTLAGVGAWRLNSELEAQGISLAELPGIAQTINVLGQRLNSTESTLGEFKEGWNKLTGRVNALDKKITVSAEAASRKSEAVAVTADSRVKADLENHIALLKERVDTLQSQHEADTARLASLNGQLSTLDNALSTLRQDTGQQIASVRAVIPRDAGPELASLRSSIDRNKADLTSVENQIARDRRDFEVQPGPATELIPGVLLTIKDVNVGRQEVSGWVYLQHEHRFVWLKGHGLLHPITIYGVQDKQPREIVLTRVTKNNAVGYVLTPKEVATVSAAN